MAMPKLSILDLCHIFPQQSATATLLNATKVAQLADRLGYTRIWYAEHHNIENVMSASPALMAAHVGQVTQRLRVGSGGVMLPNHSPLKVVEDFAFLEALHPGRIDLGIGRAPGTNERTARALRRSRSGMGADQFPELMAELLHFFRRDFPSDHPYHPIVPTPDPTLVPSMYMLGSSTGSVQVAIDEGLGFAFAAHINPDMAVPIMNVYRRQFKPSEWFPKPYAILAIMVFTAESHEEAEYLAGPALVQWAQLSTGRKTSLLSEEEAQNYNWSPLEERAKKSLAPRFVIGDIQSVTKKLRHMCKQTKADELMIVDSYGQMETRQKALTLLAEAFNLKGQEE